MKQLIASPKKWTNVTKLGQTIPIDVILEGNITSFGIKQQNVVHVFTFLETQ